MPAYKSEISALRGLLRSSRKNRSKKHIDASNEDEIMTQDTGIEEAISAMEGNSYGKDYSTDNNLIKNFSVILDSTGKETKESSKIYPVVKAVETLTDPSYTSTLKDSNTVKFGSRIEEKGQEVIDVGEEYLNAVGYAWTTSGKQRKALVQAVVTQVREIIDSNHRRFGVGMTGAYLKKIAFKNIKEVGSQSWIDFMSSVVDNYLSETAGKIDLNEMSSDEKNALRDEIMREYNLTGEEADKLLNNRNEVVAADMTFSRTGIVTADLIRKLASQLDKKKEIQQITGGVRAGVKENERLKQAQAAAGAAKMYATEQYGIDLSKLDSSFSRVLVSLMDLSGTEEARKKNADLYKDYMNTRNDREGGGTYWKIVTDFLAMDLSLFEHRDPKFMIDHHNEIFGACEVGSEMFQNVLPKMKEDTGVEPDEDTMNNINALTSFLMDITIINTGYWDMLGSEGLDFMDLDRIDDLDSILEENYGGADDSGNAATGEVQGKADTLDNRVDKFDRDFAGDYTYLKVEQTLGGLSNIKRYKVATSKSSVKDILRNMYGWKDLKNGPRKKGEKGLAK